MKARDTASRFALAVTFGLIACQQNGATDWFARGSDVPFSRANTAALHGLDGSAMNATTAADVTFTGPEVTTQTFAPATVTTDAGASATTAATAPATDLRDGGSVVRDVAVMPGDVTVVGDAGIASNNATAQRAANPNVVYVPVPVPVTVPVFGGSPNAPGGNVPTPAVPTTPSLGSTGTNLNGTIPGGPVGATPGVPPSAPPGAFPPPPAVPPSAVPPTPFAPPGAFGIPAPPMIPVPR